MTNPNMRRFGIGDAVILPDDVYDYPDFQVDDDDCDEYTGR
jgi:hypothetical protein